MQKQDLEKYNLPDSSGVYLFKNNYGDILYVGKATNLRDRVRSYFSHDLVAQRGKRLVDMIAKSTDLSFETTDSVLEALLLEARLIEKHQPPYNALGKDNKSFYYIVITKEDLPQVLLMRGRDLEKKEFKKEIAVKKKFGPFPYGNQIKQALRIIRKIFPFNDASSIKKDQKEFYKQLGLAPDLSNSEFQKKYSEHIENIILFLSGNKKKIVKVLENSMMQKAKDLRFEEANAIKRQLFSLKHIHDVSLIKEDSIEKRLSSFRIEGYDIAHISGSHMVGVMTVIEHGEPEKKEYRKFIIRGFTSSNDVGALEEVFRRRLGHVEWSFPELIVVDGALPQKNCIQRILREHGLSIPVVSVVKNEKHKPKGILGLKKFTEKYKKEIILVNNEAHRFAIGFHRKKRGQSLKK